MSICVFRWEDERCKDAKFFPINSIDYTIFIKTPKEALELHRNDSTIHLENKQAGRAENNVKTRNTRFRNLSEELGWGSVFLVLECGKREDRSLERSLVCKRTQSRM